MITQDDLPMMDYGLSVFYNNNKSYTLVGDGILKEYPVGGLICEYCRLAPTELKEVILDCPGLDDEATPDTLLETMMAFQEKLFARYDPVIAIMVLVEFMTTVSEWFQAIRQGDENEYVAMFQRDEPDAVKEYIFKDTPYSEVGRETNLQLMLSAYLHFADVYSTVKLVFYQIVGYYGEENETRENILSNFGQFYSTFMQMQHIDFRIVVTESGFESMYTLKSSISLLLFEMANSINHEANFKKCPNCEYIFVPDGRSDTVYCGYPSPQNKSKTCREVGAQAARANKEKSDIVTREYRKTYMRYKMKTQRHPGNKEAWDRFSDLTSGIKEWRQELAQGTKSTEQFLEWLSQFS